MKVRLLGRFSVFIAVARNYIKVGLETKRAGSRSCQASREGSDVSDRYPRSCARNSDLKVLGKPSESTILGWLPALDGLRALAILAVLIHHGNTLHFSNWALGNAGVAIFFQSAGFWPISFSRGTSRSWAPSITTTFCCGASSEFGPPIFSSSVLPCTWLRRRSSPRQIIF